MLWGTMGLLLAFLISPKEADFGLLASCWCCIGVFCGELGEQSKVRCEYYVIGYSLCRGFMNRMVSWALGRHGSLPKDIELLFVVN